MDKLKASGVPINFTCSVIYCCVFVPTYYHFLYYFYWLRVLLVHYCYFFLINLRTYTNCIKIIKLCTYFYLSALLLSTEFTLKFFLRSFVYLLILIYLNYFTLLLFNNETFSWLQVFFSYSITYLHKLR